MNWPLVELGDICQVKGGKRLPKGHDLVEKVTPHPYIRARDIKDGKIIFDQPVYLEKDTFLKISRYIVNKGDVILTIAGTVAETALVGEEFDNASLTENAVKILTNKTRLDPLFLKYLFQAKHIKDYLVLVASGAAQPKLGIYKIQSTKILLPSLPTQRKIAAILSAYDDLIENNLKRIKLLEEKAQLTYEEWFVRMKFPSHESTPINEETGLPEGWKVKTLGELGDVVTGKTPPTSKAEYYNGNIPFIKTPDMSGFPYVIKTNQYLSESGANTQKNKFLPKNSLVVSCIGSAGVYALVSKLSQCNQQINAIVFKNEFYTFFTYCYAKHLKPVLDALGSNGATMTNVNKGKFEKIEIVIPIPKLLESFHSQAKNQFESIYLLLNQIELLKEARDILLPRLMTGMIDVYTLDLSAFEQRDQEEMLMAAEPEGSYKNN